MTLHLYLSILQGMSRLNAPPAPSAMADVKIEAAEDGPAGNLCLELLGLMILHGRPVTVRTAIRQGHVDDLVGFAGGNRAVSLGAVILAGLATRRGRRILGRPLGERRGLPLVGPQDFLKLRGELTHLGFQVSHLPL